MVNPELVHLPKPHPKPEVIKADVKPSPLPAITVSSVPGRQDLCRSFQIRKKYTIILPPPTYGLGTSWYKAPQGGRPLSTAGIRSAFPKIRVTRNLGLSLLSLVERSFSLGSEVRCGRPVLEISGEHRRHEGSEDDVGAAASRLEDCLEFRGVAV
jgi:hypothetical protein